MFSLKYKIAVTIFVLEAIMMSVVLWATLSYAHHNTRDLIDSAEGLTLEIIGKTARVALFTEEFDLVQPLIEALPGQPNILRAVLLDHRGIIVASDDLLELGESMPDMAGDASSYWRTRELRNASGLLGRLAVQYSTAPLKKAFAEIRNLGIAYAITGMSLIAIASLSFGYLLTRRLDQVVHAADRLAKGHYETRSDLDGRDEVSRLGHVFDGMAEHIEADRKQLADVNLELEQRVRERTRSLEKARKEYESFAYAVSHDLNAPLRRIIGFSEVILEDHRTSLDAEAVQMLQRIQNNCKDMNELIKSLLQLSRIDRSTLQPNSVNFSLLAGDIIEELKADQPQRRITVSIQPDVIAKADMHLMRIVLQNLLGNAWKFTAGRQDARVDFGVQENERRVFFVRDNGAGFDPAYADQLFMPFQRLHSEQQFAGTGIGLSTVQRIIHRHYGDIWAEGKSGEGATFYFTLGDPFA